MVWRDSRLADAGRRVVRQPHGVAGERSEFAEHRRFLDEFDAQRHHRSVPEQRRAVGLLLILLGESSAVRGRCIAR